MKMNCEDLNERENNNKMIMHFFSLVFAVCFKFILTSVKYYYFLNYFNTKYNLN